MYFFVRMSKCLSQNQVFIYIFFCVCLLVLMLSCCSRLLLCSVHLPISTTHLYIMTRSSCLHPNNGGSRASRTSGFNSLFQVWSNRMGHMETEIQRHYLTVEDKLTFLMILLKLHTEQTQLKQEYQ